MSFRIDKLVRKGIVFLGVVFFTVFLPVFDSLSADVSKCLHCHLSKNSQAVAPGAPSFAGQHPEYIVRQLDRFAVGAEGGADQRVNRKMAHEAISFPRSEWWSVAKALSNLQCTNYGQPDLMTIKDNPCASCHGERGLSDSIEVPNLAGQDLRYMFNQYKKFREPYQPKYLNGQRANSGTRYHPTMGPVSAHNSEKVLLILEYYAKLPCR